MKASPNDCLSDEAKLRAKNFLPDCHDEQSHKQGPSASFTTASGKKCKLSDEAKLRAKNFLLDCHDEQSHKQGPSASFTTASGKKCKLSDEAKLRAKNFLKDCHKDDTPQSTYKSNRNPFKKPRTISQNASNKADPETPANGFIPQSSQKSPRQHSRSRAFPQQKTHADFRASVLHQRTPLHSNRTAISFASPATSARPSRQRDCNCASRNPIFSNFCMSCNGPCSRPCLLCCCLCGGRLEPTGAQVVHNSGCANDGSGPLRRVIGLDETFS